MLRIESCVITNETLWKENSEPIAWAVIDDGPEGPVVVAVRMDEDSARHTFDLIALRRLKGKRK